jgi:8-oxo-dGTP diphosphatase
MDCEAAVVLIVSDNKFLVIKRAERDGDPWSGDMGLPGGHVKSGEKCIDAALRECKEEIGFEPKIIGFLGYYFPNNVKIKVAVFLARYENEKIKIDNNEISDYFWISKDELTEKEGAYIYKDYKIWGMTFRILKDYLQKRE